MSDETARREALDVSRSFIVQAPAGSGKTELLIQRYLALLDTVEVPEQIIAITFTRKAAAEMRARVLGALAGAAEGAASPDGYRRETHALATRVLARDEAYGWALRAHPQRLRIDTLDALNAWLAHQLPLLSGGVAGAGIVEDARDLHALAARRLMEQLGDATPVAQALQRVLRHANCGVARLEDLLTTLLPTRDQWLRYLQLDQPPAELARRLETTLGQMIDAELHALREVLPEAVVRQLPPLMRHAARHAHRPASRDTFAPWLEREHFPQPTRDDLAAWRAIRELLLTRQGGWRRRLGSTPGFSAEHPGPRDRLAALIACVDGEEEVRIGLQEVAALPDPLLPPGFEETLGGLRTLLHHLVGELALVFADRNTVDFVELALAAQQALGDAQAPSELLLALDRRLQHVLVDEFQDTSHTQINLLGLLTSGWEPGDGRTVFLVGDPMQSIYRFRNADMSLFLRARDRGVGDIRCDPLTLERNFRARPELIEWINQTFVDVFPGADDPRIGAAGFNPSTATRARAESEAVQFHALSGDRADEVQRVAEIVLQERARSATDSIAILVQSRQHLTGLAERLRPLNLPVHAVEINAPNEQQVTQDLIGLTRALTHFGDRIAWLGVLHAPWCGLTWADLHALAWDDREQPIWTLMNEPERVARLSADGQARLSRTREVIRLAFQARASQPFARWIERTWMSLEGPACLDFADELDGAERFFLTLAEHAVNGDLDDPTQLEARFMDPRVGGDAPREEGIEIMTIHRAKGLEFDTVILFGLGRDLRPEEARGLYWHARTRADGTEDVLLAPLARRSPERDALTEWLKRRDRLMELSERARLLYVAATRARERLHLVAQLEPGKAPPAKSLLACLWPHVSDRFDAPAAHAPDRRGADPIIVPVLRRLTQPAQPPGPPQPAPETELRPEFEWAGQAAVQVGTVVHRWLHRIAREGVGRWSGERVAGCADRFQAQLRLLGVEDDELSWASGRVVKALQQVLVDRRGRWTLAAHPDARSELPVSVAGREGMEKLRLDRTFIDEEGVRWIIDFKTSAHEGGATEAFVSSEVERYRAQLERYAYAMSQLEDRAVRVGLYFPLLQAFADWEPTLLP